MGMSFFAPCPSTGGLSVPRKSGHTRNADLTMIRHGGGCPDLSGSAGALLLGHETKKDIPMLIHRVISKGSHGTTPETFQHDLRLERIVAFFSLSVP
jgi:hypothetical protein